MLTDWGASAPQLRVMTDVRQDPDPAHPDFCYSHYALEPRDATTFLVCGECFHAFATEADLVAADLAVRTEIENSDWRPEFKGTDDLAPRPASQIRCCPHCVHDF